MAEIIFLLLGVSFILFFGFLAEFIFRKIYVPDILFLITLGFIIGPFGLDYISPAKVSQVAPLFTTFALFFLVYHGAFNIDLGSFVRGLTKSLRITVYNFVISVGVVFIIMHLVTSDAMLSLLVGFMLGGISSAFVIPILRQLRVNSETYSILTLESTMTDVFTIVFSLTVIEIMVLQIFNPQAMVAKIVSLFVVAGFV
ncbi:MAG: cation:proton antiporter, partial [Candidatus Altiarchaeota archaeon]|nr:cation:proton antiporter [Candidatus Altiarchaeota archaeon]